MGLEDLRNQLQMNFRLGIYYIWNSHMILFSIFLNKLNVLDDFK